MIDFSDEKSEKDSIRSDHSDDFQIIESWFNIINCL